MYLRKMYSNLAKYSFLILFFPLFYCSDKGPTNPVNQNKLSDKISVGDATHEVSQDISPTGGKVTISNQESRLNGLEIIVTENGYDKNRTFVISSSPILEHKLGEYFNPVTPMIIIENGGGYSDMPMSIKVPIKKEDDEFILGFFFNELNGDLEPLPTIKLDDSFVTLETRHFALSSITSPLTFAKKSDIKSQANLVITSIKENILANQNIINSGFTPGVDDWEFINYGSYIAPGGHCAGQSITAMWYYYEKKLRGESALFHRYDLVNNSDNPLLLWQDNPLGYRFASTLQRDANWGEWVERLELQSAYPYIVWNTFIGAMLITGEPQSVIIRNSTFGGGHAMIVYKINVSEGKLYVADPNYPNNRTVDGTSSIRFIKYVNSKFEPYPSYAKVGDPGKEYDQIAYYSKTSTFDWARIGERFTELEDKTIGNDRFKSYDLFVKANSGDIQFSDGMEISERLFKLFCKNENIPGFLPGTDRLQRIEIYDSSGNFLSASDANGIASLNLNSGMNTLGIYICGYLTDQAFPNKFYDFRWVKVNYLRPISHGFTTCEVEVNYSAKIHSVSDYEHPNATDIDTTYWTQHGFTFKDTYSAGSFDGNTFTYNYNFNETNIYFSLTISDDKSEITSIDYTYNYIFEGNAGRTENDIVHSLNSIPLKQVNTTNNEAIYYIGGVETCNSIANASYNIYNEIFGTLQSSSNLVDYICNQESYIRVKLK